MEVNKPSSISRIVKVFKECSLPEAEIRLVGYAALIDSYNLKVPLPHKLAAISNKHKRYDQDNWVMYTPRHMP